MIRRFVPIAIAVAVAVAAPLAAASQAAQTQRQAAAAKPSPVLASLQGVWVITQVNGQDVAGSGQELTISIKDNTYEQAVNGQIIQKGTFTLDDSKKPMSINVTVVEGDGAGQMLLGVFELSGKTITYKLADPGGARPTDFAPADGHSVAVMVKK